MLEVIIENGLTIVKIESDVVAGQLSGMREQLQSLAESGIQLVLDFENVSMIDSTGIGMLISLQNAFRQKGGKLILRNVSDDISRMFRIMRLEHHLEIEKN